MSSSRVKIDDALDLLNEVSANFHQSIAKSIPQGRIDKVIAGLASLTTGEGDEYLENVEKAPISPRDLRQLHKEIEFLKEDKKSLTDELDALRQVDATRQEILTGRIDQLLQEMHVLKNERAVLYEQVASIHEALELRDRLLSENAEVKHKCQDLSLENERLRKTNTALTQQLFNQSADAGNTVESGQVLDVLTGRAELDQEKLLSLLAKMHQEMMDERQRFEQQIDVLHSRIRQLETSATESSPGPSSSLGRTVSSIGSKVSGFFQGN
jgi:chromosome segregation ATPase